MSIGAPEAVEAFPAINGSEFVNYNGNRASSGKSCRTCKVCKTPKGVKSEERSVIDGVHDCVYDGALVYISEEELAHGGLCMCELFLRSMFSLD